jgi:enoyl-CoA hydratase/carnithine racemase
VQDIQTERDGEVLFLRFNRPEKKNAITQAMYEALAEGLEAANGHDGIGVCVMLGSAGRVQRRQRHPATSCRPALMARGWSAILRFLRALATLDRPLMAGVSTGSRSGSARRSSCIATSCCDTAHRAAHAFHRLGLTPEAGLQPARRRG